MMAIRVYTLSVIVVLGLTVTDVQGKLLSAYMWQVKDARSVS